MILRKVWKYLEGITEADLAIEVRGKSFEELLKNILLAFFEICTAKKPEKEKAYLTKEITISGRDEQELIVNFVEELIFQKDVDGLVFLKGSFSKIKKGYKAVLEGGPVEKYGQGVDIKALSYHHLEVERTKTGWRAVLVFDV